MLENVGLPGRIRNEAVDGRARNRCSWSGWRSGLCSRNSSPVVKQRAAVAGPCSMSRRSSADEPTGSLDRHNALVVYRLPWKSPGSVAPLWCWLLTTGTVSDVDARYQLSGGRLEPAERVS